ncbi:MAG: PEP-CTERM-box response regulator transcription factor [Thiobacillus sp. 63-78]|uniref:PEP-CTERM-box response regulator transcription factor n=1 Tax=Thiobacillus sp. 63-78 TaxID=1895859 RepID=UPI00086D2D05|nr:PEP-CTERM-box response regulator transcription factor [Thiobacillus sp. 63-78]MBN8762456.1 PEP-CTERM-box response regulator transcription factor [Thiobacillus sp.]ODV14423.1 MAG: PEP-CTERM-box response regulator transcription factor [Thiobacillus sp. SCN 64-317]MBN8766291.1 PEP-CTERM-box response regulator transcription factor [Thiobacillus sp.]MBN8773790.1 PEP-CTERM-box response regulator transcription factor [Thiobacillus sp.]OJZ15942.1 MAG: PEP-CTERM-box response regulator transcription 
MSDAKQKILLVEDDPGLQKQLKWSLSDYELVIAADRDSAIAQLRRHEPPVVMLDLGLPPDVDGATEGLAALQQILSLAPSTKVIVVTGNLDRSNAVKAIHLGAYDFFQKPFDPDVLALMIARALHVQALETENRMLAARQAGSALQGLITSSEPMLKICRTIEKVAPANATVLLLGESGTGKEVLARGIHELSPRAGKRFVAINCAAIPDTLLESELFGYEKGAFTGAAKQTIGRIEYANEGTLFLDEIGDLPMPLQAKLLRFLQERVIERLGGRGEIPVDVRVVCATHRDLADMIREGSFREDLYYRLSEISVKIPPLRERPGDAVLLAQAFLERYAREQGRNLRGFTADALGALEAHAWPGNVREMENLIKRATIMAEGNQITAVDLGLEPSHAEPLPFNLRQARESAERLAVSRALAHSDGNIAQAAELLGITRPTLYDLMAKIGMK